MVYPDMECYPVLKRNQLLSREITWKKLKCILPNERSPSEKATYCVTFWKRRNYGDNKKISSCGGWEARRINNRWSTEDF